MAQTQVFIFAGQSNAQNHITTDCLAPLARVPSFQRTGTTGAINQWAGDCPASPDTAAQYAYPTTGNSPCLYNESSTGNFANYYDGWGRCVGESPVGVSGTLTLNSSAGFDLPFLQKHLAVYPALPIACVKVAVGGTALRGNWLPYESATGTVAASTSASFTLNASDSNQFLSLVGHKAKILAGPAAGSIVTITAYNSGTRVASVTWPGGVQPNVGDAYGIDQDCFSQLRLMLADAIGRLNIAGTDYRFAGFVWMQGESGAHGTSTDDSQYLADARGMFAAVRSITSRSDLPVMVGRIGNNWGWTSTGVGDANAANAYLKEIGYPYAALVASYQSNHSLAVDGRADPTPYAATLNQYLACAALRRTTQATLAADPHCAGWSNDDLPVLRPYSKAWQDYWLAQGLSGFTSVASMTAGNTTFGQDWYGYHTSPDGQLAAGERAFAAYRPLSGLDGRVRVTTRGGKFRTRSSGA